MMSILTQLILLVVFLFVICRQPCGATSIFDGLIVTVGNVAHVEKAANAGPVESIQYVVNNWKRSCKYLKPICLVDVHCVGVALTSVIVYVALCLF